MTPRVRKILAFAARVCALFAFFTHALPSMAQGVVSGAPGAATPGSQPNSGVAADYRLGAGDNIRILVFQNPDLTLETRVSENGSITFPLVGEVRVGGMTIASAEKAIAKGLADGGYIRHPQVNIVMLQMRGNQISVLGQVNKPGRFPLETVSLRVSEMLAIAGGVTTGGADTAILSGVRDGKPFRREIDIAGIFLNGKLQDDVAVEGGDVIYVHRAQTFYIYGEVQKPGAYRVEHRMTVRQALATAGGPTSRGTERRLGLYRRGGGGAVESLTPDMNDSVLADDVYYVRESLF